jgi:hypothetical protein
MFLRLFLPNWDAPKQFGRVNLLVGKNNSGKTSILEGIHQIRAVVSLCYFLIVISVYQLAVWVMVSGTYSILLFSKSDRPPTPTIPHQLR